MLVLAAPRLISTPLTTAPLLSSPSLLAPTLRAGVPVASAHAASGGLVVCDVLLHKGLSIINYGAGFLLLFACFSALANTFVFFFNKLFERKVKTPFDFIRAPGGTPSLTSIRFSLCSMILVALNFLVAVDVIETLIKPASSYLIMDLYKLAIVAGVRTLLAYFLGKETEELEHELERATGVEVTV